MPSKCRSTTTQLGALLIKPSRSKTYTKVLSVIWQKVDYTKTGTEVRLILRSRTGEILFELVSKPGDKAAFADALKNILGKSATVK